MACELCKLSNMTDELRRHPGTPQIGAIRSRLKRNNGSALCANHDGRQAGATRHIIGHWVDRVERLLTRY